MIELCKNILCLFSCTQTIFKTKCVYLCLFMLANNKNILKKWVYTFFRIWTLINSKYIIHDQQLFCHGLIYNNYIYFFRNWTMLPTRLYVNMNIVMFKITPPLSYLLLCFRPESHKRYNFYWLQIFLPRIWFADLQLRNHDLGFISELDQKYMSVK